MKTKLIKLSEKHYIVVDDSEIKDCSYWTNTNQISHTNKMHPKNWNGKPYKITHSFGVKLEGVENKPLSEVQEAIYGFSVEKMANELISCSDNVDVQLVKEVWKAGFNTHKELVKDKSFTVEDMERIYDMGRYSVIYKDINNTFESSIKAFFLPTEWNIEIIDGKIKLL